MFKIIKRRKIWFAISGLLMIGSIVSLLVFGLNVGIDFKGGTLKVSLTKLKQSKFLRKKECKILLFSFLVIMEFY
ncbi:hypothetical protein ACFL24_02885 [Patescibacteria group bacterium]